MTERYDDIRTKLATHADDGLDDEDRLLAEEYVAGSADAQAELDELGQVIARVRGLEPRPEREPDWDALAADIGAACVAPAPSFVARLYAGLEWRHAAVVGVAVAAIAMLLMWPESSPSQVAGEPSPGLDIEDFELDEAEAPTVDDLKPAQLDELLLSLATDLAEDDYLLSADIAVEWGGDDSELGYATGFGLDLYAEPAYAGWLEGLDEAELDALDDLLDEEQAG